MVPKQAGFYGKPFKASRGVRQGDIMSPIIFNITTDAVIRESLKQFYNIYPNDTDTQAILYADDGVLCGNDAEKIQFLLDIFTTNFARIGLKMNVEKTKSLIMNGGKMSQKLSNIAYNRMVTNTGLSFQEKQKEDITCELCGIQLKAGSIKTHQITQRCISNRKTHRKDMIEQMIEKIKDIDIIECQSIVDSHFDSLTNSSDCTEIRETTPQTYHVDMDNETISSCPVINCPYSSDKRQRMRFHFRNMHNDDIIIINQEGLLPRCIECGLF